MTLGAEDIAVKASDPLPPPRGNIQIPNSGLDMWRNAVPIKLRVCIREIGRTGVAELPVHADFFELRVKCISLAQVMRISKLSDQVGGPHQQTLFLVRIIRVKRWKAGEFNGAGDLAALTTLLVARRSITKSFERSTW